MTDDLQKGLQVSLEMFPARHGPWAHRSSRWHWQFSLASRWPCSASVCSISVRRYGRSWGLWH